METPIDVFEVIGWEMIEQKNGKTGVRIYGIRDLAGTNGDGKEAVRCYINPEYVKYQPELGHKIIAVEGKYGVDRIIRVA